MLVVRPLTHGDVRQSIELRFANWKTIFIGRPRTEPELVKEWEDEVHEELDGKGIVHHLKVVDPENDNFIIACATWFMYPQGYQGPVAAVHDEFEPLLPPNFHFCSRNVELGERPHMYLDLLVTSEEHRRRGAGSLLVRWGIDKSEETGFPIYVQASLQGRKLYGHHGFVEIRRVDIDLSEYGLSGHMITTDMMRQPAKHLASSAPESPCTMEISRLQEETEVPDKGKVSDEAGKR